MEALSHWQLAEKAAKEKAGIYETKEEGMEGWTQEQLEEAINKKHGTFPTFLASRNLNPATLGASTRRWGGRGVKARSPTRVDVVGLLGARRGVEPEQPHRHCLQVFHRGGGEAAVRLVLELPERARVQVQAQAARGLPTQV
jgi:hypothetical protein